VRILLVLAVALVFVPSLARAQESGADPRMVRVEEWLKAILHHQPGEFDEAAERIAHWSHGDLQALSVDAVALAQLMRDLRLSYFIIRRPGQKVTQQVRFTPRQVDRMRLLACAAAGLAKQQRDCLLRKTLLLLDDELLQLNDAVAAATARGQLDYVLRRAAMLHADVGMSTRSIAFDREYRPPDGAARRVSVRVEDGRDTATLFGAVHWDIARSLLDVVRPAGDPMVLLWYQATATWMQATGYHETVDHLTSAIRLFPRDATLLFLRGAEHESLARPAIQAAARSVDLPPGYQLAVQSHETEFRESEAYFRRALAEAPDHFEARMRLGRVLLQRGRSREAVEELRRADSAAPDDLMKYYSAMFLGGAEEAVGNFDAADALYSRASTLYPNAQSPHVARSALARRRGNLAGALTSLERVFELAAEYPDGEDPWWTYDIAAGREAEALLEELTQMFREERP
jgi:tetratricopeptide (TPR) repeat protein